MGDKGIAMFETLVATGQGGPSVVRPMLGPPVPAVRGRAPDP
jgi:hypothetical protein